jgi:hypothetical protein
VFLYRCIQRPNIFCLRKNWIYRLYHGKYTVVAKLGLSIELALISTSGFNPTTFPPTSYSATHLQSIFSSTSYTSGRFPKATPKNLHACCVSSVPVTCNSLPDFTNQIRDYVPRVNHQICASYCNFILFFFRRHPFVLSKRKQKSL